jgi:hypothetical protein
VFDWWSDSTLLESWLRCDVSLVEVLRDFFVTNTCPGGGFLFGDRSDCVSGGVLDLKLVEEFPPAVLPVVSEDKFLVCISWKELHAARSVEVIIDQEAIRRIWAETSNNIANIPFNADMAEIRLIAS